LAVPLLPKAAKERGVKVYVLLDKSQVKNNRYSVVTYLTNHQISVWIDSKPSIAHNKVVLLDRGSVITAHLILQRLRKIEIQNMY
jgi:phosphatidylserine/phosphatidylglycerophosphate/cardiolipin synthase-like enzyme